MDLTKRKIFLLLLGACGIILILTANFIDFRSTHQVFLVAANFHNSSLSYLTALNFSLNILSNEKPGLKYSLTKDNLEIFDEVERNPKFTDVNVTDVTLRYVNMHNNTSLHNKASSDVNNEIHSDFGAGESNKYQSSSKSIEPHSQNNDASLPTDLESLGYSSETSFRRKNKLSDSTVYDKYGNLRLVHGQTAFNNENSMSKGNSIGKDYKNTDTLKEIIEQSVDITNNEPREAKNTNEPSANRDNAKSGTLNHVDPEQIQEEVRLQGNDYTNIGVHAQNENVATEMKHGNSEDIRDLKKTFESSNYPSRNVPTAGFLRENLNQGEFENRIRTSEILNLEQAKVIASQTKQHSDGNQIYEQARNALKDRQDGSKDLGLSRYKSQAAGASDEGNVTMQEGFSSDPSCRSRATGVEDILCMKRPNFLPSFRNPCWYQRSSLRCLPYFHIIGVCKTGTTDLFERLSHHPQIIKNSGILGKETWYWTWKRYGHSHFHRQYASQLTLEDFIDMFDSQSIEHSTKRRYNGSVYHPAVTGHGDPMDFWDQSSWKLIPQNDPAADVPEVTTPSLIKHVNPNVKLILLLRDPVERLFSNYLHGQFGTSSTQFHEDVLTSLSMLTSCTKNRSMKSCLYDEDIIRRLTVPISGSFYSIHLQEWLKVFPRKQIYITRTEDFSKSVADTLLGIFRFLKLDPLPTRDLYRIANMPHYYNTKAKQTAGEIFNETRTVLHSLFQPYNSELATILNDQKYNFNVI